MSDYLIPLLLALIGIVSLYKKENGYEIMVAGAADGLKWLTSIAPSLVILLSAVSMLRASGALESIALFLEPAVELLGIPAETILLMLVRPISGSAALAIGSELILSHGPDSLIGRTAAVMLGSTETTFYTLSVYFGACGITKTRYALPAALIADLTGFLAAAWTVRLFFP